MKARMAAVNRSYHALTRIMESWDMSDSSKLEIYRTMIKPIVMVMRDGLYLNIW
jgi:hypothetical protein